VPLGPKIQRRSSTIQQDDSTKLMAGKEGSPALNKKNVAINNVTKLSCW